MPQYLTPGVYVEEVPSGIAPIAGVGTNTAGFVGVVDYCELPPDRAQLVKRNLKYVVFRKGLLISENNVGNIVAAAQAAQLQQLTVRGSTPVTEENLTGMKLLTDAAGQKGEVIEALTVLDQPKAAAIVEAKRATKLRVEGKRDVNAEALLQMQLGEDLVVTIPAQGEILGVTREITDENVDVLIQLLGRGTTNVARVEPLRAVNDAKLIENYTEYVKYFGGFAPGHLRQDYLSRAIFGFFDNGGTLCWVTRVAEGADDDATEANLVEGLNTFNDIDEIALVAIPGNTTPTTQNAIITHCERLQDRFAILDGNQQGGDNQTVAEIQSDVRDSTYAAMYWPWLDLDLKDDKGEKRYYPPSGHMAGVYARVDDTRGVHKAPANEVIRGPIDLQFRVSKAKHGLLNPDGINVIRKFDSNIKVYGARTLGGDDNTEFKYINVRRLFLFLRESIDEGTQWAVFEPNTEELWQRIIRNINAFLNVVWRSGAFFGSTPQQAYFVKCDAELNPWEVRVQGQVITQIGVAPAYPAEFVIFRISQIAGPAS